MSKKVLFVHFIQQKPPNNTFRINYIMGKEHSKQPDTVFFSHYNAIIINIMEFFEAPSTADILIQTGSLR